MSILLPQLPTLALLDATSGARAEIALHGAHMLSWSHGGRERLFLSHRARTPSIRGGIPVIFPQFGLFGNGLKHGFARTRPWTVIDSGGGTARLELRDDTETQAIWPHAFLLRLEARLHARGLSLLLEVHNTGREAFDFAAGLHGYLAIENRDRAALHGLEGSDYLDATNHHRQRQVDTAVHLHGEVDRVYFNCRPALRLDDETSSMRFEAEGFPDTVIWHPGDVLAAKMNDLGSEGGRHFICVEAAQVLPRALAPGASWRGAQHFIPL